MTRLETAMGTSVDAQRNIDSDYVNAVCDMNEVTFAWVRDGLSSGDNTPKLEINQQKKPSYSLT